MRRLQVMRPLNAISRDARSVGGSATPAKVTGGQSGETDGCVIGGAGKGGGGGSGGSGGRSRRDIYAPGDFGVGEEVWIHGRRFRVVDADLTTRQWFKRYLGRNLKEAEGYPEDGYGAQRAKVSMPKKR